MNMDIDMAIENEGMKNLFFFSDPTIGGDLDDASGDESWDQSFYDSVCAVCDNGGEILCCEGECMRSFHAIKDTGADSVCSTLGFSRTEVAALKNFFCENCKRKQHQCFVCGKLGSSNKSVNTEVFRCVSAACGHFYHPKCVAKLLFPVNMVEAIACEKKIAAGESFTCPIHKCVVCKQRENTDLKPLQFASCRRCPKSYHRKCLPRRIGFEQVPEIGIMQRAWDGLLPKRILIYCLDHILDASLGTPPRNHIVFPRKHVLKLKVTNHLVRTEKVEKDKLRDEENMGKPDSSRAINYKFKSKGSLETERKLTPASPTFRNTFPVITDEMTKRMKALLEEVSSSITRADIISKRTKPSTHAYTARHVDKTITLAKVEAACEAVETALCKLDSGGNIEDAKIVCEPKLLMQIPKWKTQLCVYLGPFLHGNRYTSFGRHFTKVDKLKEIVEILHWYVQSGDMVVDFCCGANEFSRLMKEKLEEVKKTCKFKNFDIHTPKDDFNFELRDWMEVQPQELPDGSELIIGLNPPFGVRAALANKFINKALSFKPKLLILIVPRETERLDKKGQPYDLIWEDSEKLAGKSFYLPGSVDTEDKQMDQWNVRPPPLYLWSRRDWTAKHKDIAIRIGHMTTPAPNKAAYSDFDRHQQGSYDTRDQYDMSQAGHYGFCTQSSFPPTEGPSEIPAIRQGSNYPHIQVQGHQNFHAFGRPSSFSQMYGPSPIPSRLPGHDNVGPAFAGFSTHPEFRSDQCTSGWIDD